MNAPLDRPKVTPQFCFDTVALREFLRLSRASVDDSITQALNALNTPSAAGFDPNSTMQRGPRSISRQIDGEACDDFKKKVLFPTWQSRSDILHYCALVATSPDPTDPTAAIRESEAAKNKDRVVDERLDPYSGRFFPTEPRTQALATLVRTERGVENIVRHRTWDVVKTRCGQQHLSGWEQPMKQWEMETEKKR
ncbi:caffeine-induced death protein 2 [Zalerion maritima]|uniref:Caffeine-induced death protein 2 n=1 Tax=Zalerion maritima TaxID=339359 RepID=A0AAD5WM37_9PEZI|nr:caffeine-induced death protein 2 [Zalerion maritima]